MTTTPTPTPDAPVTTPAPAKKPRRSQSIVLHAEGMWLRLLLLFRPNGTATTCVIHSTKGANGKLTNVRGATQQHADADAARAAIQQLAAEAVKKGWERSKRAAGFAARPDAFDAGHLPGPRLVAKKR